ncbi:MAG: N-formylglutamate amidohydrolase, partial [Kiloniellales bacterium]
MDSYRFAEGTAPLLVSMPHVGTALPEDLAGRLTPAALAVPDTDWHVDRLYDFLPALGASVIQANYSRYLIDLNRPPDGTPLYPGASETELCPSSTFADQPLYRDGGKPGADEIAARRERTWRPYHARLAQELECLETRHGRVLLWDAHSIRSEVPRFFAGRLPDLNLGTGDGTSCDPALAALLEQRAAASGYSHALDG